MQAKYLTRCTKWYIMTLLTKPSQRQDDLPFISRPENVDFVYIEIRERCVFPWNLHMPYKFPPNSVYCIESVLILVYVTVVGRFSTSSTLNQFHSGVTSGVLDVATSKIGRRDFRKNE